MDIPLHRAMVLAHTSINAHTSIDTHPMSTVPKYSINKDDSISEALTGISLHSAITRASGSKPKVYYFYPIETSRALKFMEMLFSQSMTSGQTFATDQRLIVLWDCIRACVTNSANEEYIWLLLKLGEAQLKILKTLKSVLNLPMVENFLDSLCRGTNTKDEQDFFNCLKPSTLLDSGELQSWLVFAKSSLNIQRFILPLDMYEHLVCTRLLPDALAIVNEQSALMKYLTETKESTCLPNTLMTLITLEELSVQVNKNEQYFPTVFNHVKRRLKRYMLQLALVLSPRESTEGEESTHLSYYKAIALKELYLQLIATALLSQSAWKRLIRKQLTDSRLRTCENRQNQVFVKTIAENSDGKYRSFSSSAANIFKLEKNMMMSQQV